MHEYTVPWPQPVVTVLCFARSSTSAMPRPWVVVTCTCSRSQSTSTDAMSSRRSSMRWLRSQPSVSSSGCVPSVISVTISRPSTLMVSGNSPATCRSRLSPNSSTACTACVGASPASVIVGR